jgi:hypothetical protein
VIRLIVVANPSHRKLNKCKKYKYSPLKIVLIRGGEAHSLSLASLADAIRKELSTLGMPTVLEMAIVSSSGRELYSDLSKLAVNKISPFRDSLQLMAPGDDLSLALDDIRTIVASRVSNKAILIAITDKKVGIILTKMEGVRDKFGRLLDEIIVAEETKAGGVPTLPEMEVKTKPTYPPPTARPPLPETEKIEVRTPAPTPAPRSEVETPTLHQDLKVPERVIVPFLNDIKILERCSEKDRKFLEMFDGTLSLRQVAKKLGVPFFDVLQVANKYKNMGKVDMKEIMRG